MNTPVSIKEKKEFIQWFLNNYQLKKRENVWILNYLVNHPELLANVHFVREIKLCPRSIIMSTHCSKETAFRFYKNQLATTDAEKAFHDIRLNRDEALYVKLNFKNARQSPDYMAVVEENPFMTNEYFITEEDKQSAKELLDYSVYRYKRNQLKREIDLALDQLDQKKFLELSDKLYNLELSHSFQPKLQRQ